MLGSPRFLKSEHTVRSDSKSTRSMRAQPADAFRPTPRSVATDGWTTLIREAAYLSRARRIRDSVAGISSWRLKSTSLILSRPGICILGSPASLRRHLIWNASSLLPCDCVGSGHVSNPCRRSDQHQGAKKLHFCSIQVLGTHEFLRKWLEHYVARCSADLPIVFQACFVPRPTMCRTHSVLSGFQLSSRE